MGHGERQKRTGKNEEKKKRRKKEKENGEKEKENGKGIRAVQVLITLVSTGGTHYDDDSHTQASVCWAERLLPPASPYVFTHGERMISFRVQTFRHQLSDTAAPQ